MLALVRENPSWFGIRNFTLLTTLCNKRFSSQRKLFNEPRKDAWLQYSAWSGMERWTENLLLHHLSTWVRPEQSGDFEHKDQKFLIRQRLRRERISMSSFSSKQLPKIYLVNCFPSFHLTFWFLCMRGGLCFCFSKLRILSQEYQEGLEYPGINDTYLRSTSGLEGTPPGVLTVTGWDLVPSPFLVRAATCSEHYSSELCTLQLAKEMM